MNWIQEWTLEWLHLYVFCQIVFCLQNVAKWHLKIFGLLLKMTSFGRLEVRMMYEVPLSSKRWNICLQTIKKSHTFLRRGVLITQNSGGKLKNFCQQQQPFFKVIHSFQSPSFFITFDEHLSFKPTKLLI